MRSLMRSLLRSMPRRPSGHPGGRCSAAFTPWWLPTRASRVAHTLAEPDDPAVDREALPRDPADRVDQHRPLLGLDPLVQRLDALTVDDRDGRLSHDRPGVDAVVDDEERAAGHLHAVRQGLGGPMHPGE